MATATILRVKRRIEENPQDAFVLLCKRRKTDTEELSPSLFVFQGTVNDEENTTSHLRKILKKTEPPSEARTNNIEDIIKKMRKERKECATDSRYEVVNFSRGLDKDTALSEPDDANYSLVDLVQKRKDEDTDIQYAYDLYSSEKQEFDITMVDDIVRIENYESDLILGSYRDNGRRTPSLGESSDDSNDENNWRNEYPDTDNSSVEEEDMRRAMENCEIGDDLSSDNGEDQIYNDAPPAPVNSEDVQRYGEAYAKYKARVLANETDITDSKNLVHCSRVKDLDEESVEGYKETNDDGFYYGEDEDTEQFRDQYRHDESSDEFDQPD